MVSKYPNPAIFGELEALGYTTGTYNDRLFKYLGDQSFTGSLTDRIYAFNNTTGPITPQSIWAMNRAEIPNSTTSVSATLIYCVFRLSFFTPNRDIQNPIFGWTNWYLEATQGAEATGSLTPFTILSHGVEWSGQSKISVSPNQALAAGDTVDLTAFSCTLPANTQIWYSAVVSFQASGTRPLNYYLDSTRGEGATYTSSLTTANNQFNGTITQNSTQNICGPAYCYGTNTGSTIPSVVVIGDSISMGLNDNINGDSAGGARNGGDSKFNRGYIRRAIHGIKGYPVLCLGRQAAKIDGNYGANFAKRKVIAAKASSVILSQSGQNNIADGEATIESKLGSAWSDYATLSLPIWQAGLCPGSTSTDSWATLANQTIGSITLRDNLTTYYQGLVGSTLSGVLTPMDSLSPTPPSADHGKWSLVSSSAATIDGIHPSANSAAVAATSVASQFTA